MSLSGIQGSFPVQPNNSLSGPQNQLAQKYLSNQGVREVLRTLGIQSVGGVSVKSGIHVEIASHLDSIRFLQVTPEQSQILTTLGLSNVQLAMIVSAHEQSIDVRKKLQSIKTKTVTIENRQGIFESLGIADNEQIALIDSEGGISIIQKGLDDIEEETED